MNEFQNQWVMRDTFEDLLGTSTNRLNLLTQASAWIDELMEQLEGVDMPIGLSNFLDELAEELGDG